MPDIESVRLYVTRERRLFVTDEKNILIEDPHYELAEDYENPPQVQRETYAPGTQIKIVARTEDSDLEREARVMRSGEGVVAEVRILPKPRYNHVKARYDALIAEL